jgi:hypothetical protein
MKILVCGGRDYTDRSRIDFILKNYREYTGGDISIITGGATGADTLALKWARANGIPWKVYPADWKTHGKKAGMLRNQFMLDQESPDLVIAFPGGKGTADMIRRSKKHKVKVVEILNMIIGEEDEG